MNKWDRDQLSLNLRYLYIHNKMLFSRALGELNIPVDVANEHLSNAYRVRKQSNQTEDIK